MQSLVDMRAQLDDLQRQLGTGKKSDHLCGPRPRSRLRGRAALASVSALDGYDDTITNVGVRINLAQTALQRIGGYLASRCKLRTVLRSEHREQRIDHRAIDGLFGARAKCWACSIPRPAIATCSPGRAADKPAVDTLDHIMNGDGARAGFKQVIAERKQADLGGPGGLGRLVVTAPTADLGAGGGGCGLAVRLQAGERHQRR